ncbi:MAG TPA: TonB-dependent receptor, partial [Steroidobacteraceae bacterium]|nr:TonB-dependent receptor [Steroidobacteraceae bacterium]
LGDTNTYTFQAKLVWKPTDKVSGRFLLDYTKSDEHGSPLVFAAINEAATFPRVASQDAGCPGVVFPTSGPVPMIDDPRCANDFQGAGPYHNNGTDPLTSQFENSGGSLTFTYEATDTVALKSISSYRGLSWAGNRDADNTPLPILGTQYDVDGWQWSQELQLTYQTETLTGVAGAYYFDQGSDDIVTVALNPPPPGVQHDSDNNVVRNSSWAAFTQWTYNFNHMFGLTVGGRYTEDRKGSYPDQFDYATPNVKQVPVQWYRDTFSSFTPSGSLRLRFNDSAMMYLSYSEGFKGGGWNSHFNSVLTPAQQAALQEFKQEDAKTTELGFKLDLAGNTLRLNGAIFTSDYTNMQITYRGPCTPAAVPGNPPVCGVAPFLTNAGKASIDGAELEATWAPTSDLRIEASIGYLDATLDELVTPVDANGVPVVVLPPGLVVGNTLPFAPKYQGHFGIAYTAHAGGFDLTPRLDLSYQDTTFFDATNTVEIAQLDSYTVLNASFVFGPAAGKWSVTLGINNATDETYPIAGNSSLTTGSGYAEIAYSRPREYFGLFSYKF